NIELVAQTAEACVDISHLILDLILQPPSKIDICTRNSKEEYAQLSRLLLFSKLSNTPVSFVVPVCPDYNSQYMLQEGIGEIGFKALGAIEKVKELFESKG